MAAASDLRFRPLDRGIFVGGILATLAIHAGIALLIYMGHVRPPPAAEAPRDLVVTKLVSFGKPREKFWLPRIVQPPKPKAPAPEIKVADDPTTPPPPKEAPRPEDADVSKDLRRALEKAKMLQQSNVPEEPPEGSLTGSLRGTSTEASAGDAYATAVFEAIQRNWTVPIGLTRGDVTGLLAEIQVSIRDDGTLADARLRKPSGNGLFDDSCMQAIQVTGKVPPPPPEFRGRYRRGTLLEFAGKELAR